MDETRDRFVPNLHEFKKHILAYDFYKDIVDDSGLDRDMTSVPDHFTSAQHYIDTMLPLFYEEGKMLIERAKQTEMPNDTEATTLMRFRLEPPWIRLDLLRRKEESMTRLYGQSDLVLLTQSEDPRDTEAVHLLGIVDRSIGMMLDVTVVQGESERAMKVARLIGERAPWRLARILSTSTMVREFEGLMSLPKLPLCEFIVSREDGQVADTSTEMQAAPAPMGFDPAKEKRDEPALFSIPETLEAELRRRHNEPQLQAIMDSRKVFGITLVQGPPGTGKTKTVLGILAVLLNAQARQSSAVSYTRTGTKRKLPNATEGDSDDDESSDKDKAAGDPDAQAARELEEARRREERLKRIRRSMPWLCDGYVPAREVTMLEVLGPGDRELNEPYPKLRKETFVTMSQMTCAVAPHKVLVCTPSNAAVDEVLRRTAAEGVLDADAVPTPRMLTRLGPNLHSSLQEFSLETIVKRRLSKADVAADLNKQEAEKEKVMRESAVLFATLSISGSRDMIGFPGDFDTVVMDEASQGLEVSTLVPLKLGCRRLIMVGDPKQLPATCFSGVARKHGYERSLFQRLQESKHKVNMLQIQYRMHPAISAFPSHRFYDGRVLDAVDTPTFERMRPTAWSHIPCFGPVVFFNIKGTQTKSVQSLVNEDEAEFVLQLFTMLSALYPKEDWKNRLAVISPYQEQVKLIRLKFKSLFGLPAKGPCPVDVNTVDGFQGREKDAIIVSVVRADPESRSIGFVRDQRRMNVAFTRARNNLWVVGYAQVLARNEDWKAFIKQQQENCRLLRTTEPHNTWLKRYLRDWYKRHPDQERPSDDILGKDHGPEVGETKDEPAGDFTISAEELEALAAEERQQAKYLRPEVEEVDSEFSPSSDSGSDAGDGEGGGGAAETAETGGSGDAGGGAELERETVGARAAQEGVEEGGGGGGGGANS